MADNATISNLIPAENIDQGMLFETSKPDGESTTGYVTRSIALSGLGDAIASTLEYQTKLETNSKTITGAINELKRGGGGGGSSVAMSDNAIGGVDLTVEGTTKTLAKQRDLDTLYKITQGQLWDFVDQQENGMNVAPKGTERQSLISVDGKSEQNTTTGKNLFDINDFENHYTTVYSSIVGRYMVNVGVGKTVTLSTNFELLDDTTSIFFLESQDGSPTTSGTGVYKNKSRTITTTTGEVWIGLYIGSNRDSQVTYDKLIEQGVQIQLEVGSTATAYEPYTGGIASPNPAYPQPITSVEQLNFKVTGKNLMPILTNTNGVDMLSAGGLKCYGMIFKFDTDCYVRATAEDSQAYLARYNPDTNTLGDTGNASAGKVYEAGTWFAVTSNTTSVGTSVLRINNAMVQIEFGTEPTDYEPYREATHTITPPFALNKIGEYADYANIETGEWVKKTKRIDMGSISWIYYTNYAIPIFYGDVVDSSVAISENDALVMADHYHLALGVTQSASWFSQNASDGSISRNKTSEAFRLLVKDLRFTDVATFTQAVNGYFLIVPVNQTTEPIEATDLEYLKSLQNLDSDNVITITDQNGNDISYLMEYLVKLSEAI